MASSLSTTGRRSLLAGIGAAASLVAAVVVLWLVGAGVVDFDAGPGAPADTPAEERLRFGAPGTQAGVRGTPGASSGGMSGGGSGAATSSAVAPPTPAPGAPRAELRSGAGGGNISATPPPAVLGDSSPPPADPPEPDGGDRVARRVQETGAAVGGTFEQAGSEASEHLSELNPFVGDAAHRTGSESGRRARQAGDAAGGALGNLVPPATQALE